MKRSAHILIVLLLIGCSTPTTSFTDPDERADYPATIDEAVSILIAELSDESKASVLSKQKMDLILYHHGWGTSIRNRFGLWQGNEALMLDCGGVDIHPDSCSMKIIEGVWVQLRKSVPEDDIARIDSINDALGRIEVRPYKKEGAGLIDYVDFLNSQIQASQYAGEFLIEAKCTSEHYRLKDFRSDGKRSLSAALSYIVGQHLAAVTIVPGYVLLKPLPFKDSRPCEASGHS